MTTEDIHISRVRPLLSPAVLAEEFPASQVVTELVKDSRRAIEQILTGESQRLIVIVGPCSIHDPAAAREYATRLAEQKERFPNLFIIMRVYFEKPRTIVGWKGLINDPDIDQSFQINKGLRLARKLLADVGDLGLPCGTEFLDTTFGQYYADLISWGAIGARTAESQIHRELASGLSMPVGIKNRTDGNVKIAVDAIEAASHRHLFPSLTKEGAPAIYETGGNRFAHLILRGGELTGPNYDQQSVKEASSLLTARKLPNAIIVDASHGNSQKDPQNQIKVIDSVAETCLLNDAIKGVMLESHLVSGRQDYQPEGLTYGQSITDACLSFDETLPLLEHLNTAAARRT